MAGRATGRSTAAARVIAARLLAHLMRRARPDASAARVRAALVLSRRRTIAEERNLFADRSCSTNARPLIQLKTVVRSPLSAQCARVLNLWVRANFESDADTDADRDADASGFRSRCRCG